MVTQAQINADIDLAKRIFIYYHDKMSSYISLGSDKYIQWYKDLCVIYSLTRGLISIKVVDDLL